MTYLSNLKKEFQPHLSAWLSDRRATRDPDFFPYFGTQIYCGRQGSGKTISAVHAALKLKSKYPKAILVSNLSLSGYRAISTAGYVQMCYNRPSQTEESSSASSSSYLNTTVTDPVTGLTEHISTINSRNDTFDPRKDYIHFSEISDLHTVLTQVNNGLHGVIYLVDEIHAYFNSIESKDTPIHIFAEISQQRKQRKLIIGTSQLFLRVAKALREQCDNIIMCNTIAGVLTVMRAYDGMDLEQTRDGKLVGAIKKTGLFWHRTEDRDSYDTFQKVISSAIQYEDSLYLNKRHAKSIRKMDVKKMPYR